MRDVVPHRLKRTMRGAMAATVVATAVSMTSTPAVAEPDPPDNASDAIKQFREVSRQAEETNEEKKKADEDHAAKKAELDRLNADAKQAEETANQSREQVNRFRDQVDRMTTASYQGARMNNLSALIASKSPNDYLNRASALDILAKDNNDAIKQLSTAKNKAEDAEKRIKEDRNKAQQAETDAARLEDEVNKKKAALDGQLQKVKQQKEHLTGEDKAKLNSTGSGQVIGGSGSGAKAAQAALSKVGSPYVWGAKGPSSFDCSGLMQWAWEQAGKNVGGSTKSQAKEGKSVSQSELQPGDMIFYYSSQSHVSMYIGGGKAVHAATEGEPVKVSDYKSIGNVNGIRRVG